MAMSMRPLHHKFCEPRSLGCPKPVLMNRATPARAVAGTSLVVSMSTGSARMSSALTQSQDGPERDLTTSGASSGLDFVDLVGLDDYTVINRLQDALTYRSLVSRGVESANGSDRGPFNVRQLKSFRDNVVRNLAPTVARGFANAARAAGHVIAAPAQRQHAHPHPQPHAHNARPPPHSTAQSGRPAAASIPTSAGSNAAKVPAAASVAGASRAAAAVAAAGNAPPLAARGSAAVAGRTSPASKRPGLAAASLQPSAALAHPQPSRSPPGASAPVSAARGAQAPAPKEQPAALAVAAAAAVACAAAAASLNSGAGAAGTPVLVLKVGGPSQESCGSSRGGSSRVDGGAAAASEAAAAIASLPSLAIAGGGRRRGCRGAGRGLLVGAGRQGQEVAPAWI